MNIIASKFAALCPGTRIVRVTAGCAGRGPAQSHQKPSCRAKAFICGLLFACVSAFPQTYDLSRDFSLNSNPNGAWSYGWESNLGGAFSVLSVPVTQPSDDGVAVWSWQLSRSASPAVFFNPGTNAATSDGGS